MSRLIDRRLNGRHKSAVNRQRFMRRYRRQIRRAVADAVSRRSITDVDRGEQIRIPRKDLHEPRFRHGPGGRRESVHPGNRDFVTGDRLRRPPGGGGGGGDASNQGEGEDDFVFELSREEFLDYFFEGLELPDLVKTRLGSVDETRRVRAGHTSAGIPTNIDVVRSLRGALARRLALRAPLRRRLHALEEEHADLDGATGEEQRDRRRELEEEIEALRRRIAAVPFIDTFDLRYRHHVDQPRPGSKAVMFCLMDVSGSMDQQRKDMAKRFFILLYLFLRRNYERIEVVFIRHHTVAREVDEHEFFYSRETGGTVVSTALELMHQIVGERYPPAEWNIYGAQASDGDNWQDDSPGCRRLLAEALLPRCQYFAYVEIGGQPHQSLWEQYARLLPLHPNFAMRAIGSVAEIFPVFRDLFSKEEA